MKCSVTGQKIWHFKTGDYLQRWLQGQVWLYLFYLLELKLLVTAFHSRLTR